MKAYYGGQIQNQRRGELSVVVATAGPKSEYQTFLCPTNSETFANLTGVRAYHFPPERVYVGVSQTTGDEISKGISELLQNELSFNEIEDHFRSIDAYVVDPHFLD